VVVKVANRLEISRSSETAGLLNCLPPVLITSEGDEGASKESAGEDSTVTLVVRESESERAAAKTVRTDFTFRVNHIGALLKSLTCVSGI
jgi:hypothetical protein